MSLNSEITRIENALADIETAIKHKGQTPTGNCETYASAISKIDGGGGTDVSDTTATSNDVLEGKIFHLSSGARAVGKIKNYENQTLKSNVAPIGSGISFTISGNYKNSTLAPIEYYVPLPNAIKKGNIVVIDEQTVVEGTYETPNFSLATAFSRDVKKGKTYFNSMGQLAEGTLEGTELIKTYTPQAEPYGYVNIGLYENVNIGVDGVSITDASHLLTGDAIVTKNGEGTITSTILEGTMPNNGAITKTLEPEEEYTIPEGYHNGSGRIIAPNISAYVKDTTATSDDVVSGKWFYQADGQFVEGTASLGGKCVSGILVTNYNDGTPIECGFRPKFVCVSSMNTVGNVANTEYVIYSELDETTVNYIGQFRNSQNALAQDTTASGRIVISDTGFTHFSKNNITTNKRALYVAIG